ncbi:MAG TPA: TIGR03619 family F420-dependent LLM class oxidoreductase [Acidimicrobiales bacterium]
MAVKFLTPMPGLMRYPPNQFDGGPSDWQTRMTCSEFQLVARTIDDLGFDAVSVSEHLVLPVDLVPTMGSHWPHALTAMAFLAGCTTRLRVNSMAMVLPNHHPVELAKSIATLDVLSGGRAMATFGVGMAPGESAAMGMPFGRRGRATDEYARAMHVLWTEDRPSFDGEFVQFSDVVFEPKPLQRPHPPLWFAGRSLISLRRAADLGDGWAPSGGLLGKGPWFESDSQLPDLLDEVAERRAQSGNDRPFDVFLALEQPELGPDHTMLPPRFAPSSAAQILDEIGRLEALGVTWTMVTRPGDPATTLEGHLDDLHWLADEILAACR